MCLGSGLAEGCAARGTKAYKGQLSIASEQRVRESESEGESGESQCANGSSRSMRVKTRWGVVELMRSIVLTVLL